MPIIGAFSVEIYKHFIFFNKILYTYKYVLLICLHEVSLRYRVIRICVNLRYRYRHPRNSTLFKISILGVISKNHVEGPPYLLELLLIRFNALLLLKTLVLTLLLLITGRRKSLRTTATAPDVIIFTKSLNLLLLAFMIRKWAKNISLLLHTYF